MTSVNVEDVENSLTTSNNNNGHIQQNDVVRKTVVRSPPNGALLSPTSKLASASRLVSTHDNEIANKSLKKTGKKEIFGNSSLPQSPSSSQSLLKLSSKKPMTNNNNTNNNDNNNNTTSITPNANVNNTTNNNNTSKIQCDKELFPSENHTANSTHRRTPSSKTTPHVLVDDATATLLDNTGSKSDDTDLVKPVLVSSTPVTNNHTSSSATQQQPPRKAHAVVTWPYAAPSSPTNDTQNTHDDDDSDDVAILLDSSDDESGAKRRRRAPLTFTTGAPRPTSHSSADTSQRATSTQKRKQSTSSTPTQRSSGAGAKQQKLTSYGVHKKPKLSRDLTNYYAVSSSMRVTAGCNLDPCMVCEKGKPSDLVTEIPNAADLIEVTLFTLMCAEQGKAAALSGRLDLDFKNPILKELKNNQVLSTTDVKSSSATSSNSIQSGEHSMPVDDSSTVAAPATVQAWSDVINFLHHHWRTLEQPESARASVLRDLDYLPRVAQTDKRFVTNGVQPNCVGLRGARDIYLPAAFSRPTGAPISVQCVLCHRGNEMEKLCGQLSWVPRYELNEKSNKSESDSTHMDGDWVHSLCKYYSSRNESELDYQLVARAKRHKMKCTLCGKHRATVGCVFGFCKRNYHLPCAIADGGEWHHVDFLYYCSQHYDMANRRGQRLCHWPKQTTVRYARQCDWSGIKPSDVALIEENHNRWEAYYPFWFTRNLESPLQIKPIGEGHWAYCPQLAKKKDKDGGDQYVPRLQYEVVAARDIERGEVIGEYVGVVKYAHEARSEYVAAFYCPDDMGENRLDLVIDAADVGNETRYINSVNSHTALFIRQNATMNTVWCRGSIRIIIEAIAHVPRGHPVVLDYEEHGSTFFVDDDVPSVPNRWLSPSAPSRNSQPRSQTSSQPMANSAATSSHDPAAHTSSVESTPANDALALTLSPSSVSNGVVRPRAHLPPFNGNEPYYNAQLMTQCIPRMIIDLPALDIDGEPVSDLYEIAAQQAALDDHLVDNLYKLKWRGGAPVDLPSSSSSKSTSRLPH